MISTVIKPFLANAFILYPLKTLVFSEGMKWEPWPEIGDIYANQLQPGSSVNSLFCQVFMNENVNLYFVLDFIFWMIIVFKEDSFVKSEVKIVTFDNCIWSGYLEMCRSFAFVVISCANVCFSLNQELQFHNIQYWLSRAAERFLPWDNWKIPEIYVNSINGKVLEISEGWFIDCLSKSLMLIPSCIAFALHKNWSFRLSISSVNVRLRIRSHLLKKSLMENFIFHSVLPTITPKYLVARRWKFATYRVTL